MLRSRSLRLQVGRRLLLLALVLSAGPPVWAQTAPVDTAEVPVRWRLYVDGAPTPWPGAASSKALDSLRAVARAAVGRLQRAGYYLARVDSVVVDTSRGPSVVRLYVRRGPEVPVGAIRIRGNEAFETDALRRLMETRTGRPLQPDMLEADLKALLAKYEAAGYPLAQVRVARARLTSAEISAGPAPRLLLTIAIDEGRSLRLEGIELEGAERTRPSYVAHVTRLHPGDPLADYDPEVLRERLEATGLFERVGEPELLLTSDSTARLRIPLEEQSPGVFNLVLGYLPPSAGGGAGQLVGSGHLALRNLFGGGRTLSLRLARRPGRVSRAEARLVVPFLLGWPLRAEVHFEGLQQDSTYGEQHYGFALGYRLRSGLTVGLTASREFVRPGPAGARLRPPARPSDAALVQRVPRSRAWFAGIRVRYRRVDDPLNPRRGFFVETKLEEGRKTRTRRVVTSGDTTLRRTTLRQERLHATVRFFVPTFRRQALVLGGDAAVLLSDTYVLSDLFRFGGATSLRGYDEDRFRGNIVARLLAEYRFQLARRAYAYAFFDLGYVETPDLDGREPPTRGLHPGYGFGLQFDTRLGLVNTSYALNPQDGILGGRIHLGLSVGL